MVFIVPIVLHPGEGCYEFPIKRTHRERRNGHDCWSSSSVVENHYCAFGKISPCPAVLNTSVYYDTSIHCPLQKVK